VNIRIREADADDLAFLIETLGWAVCWRDNEIDPAVVVGPSVSRYADGFRRSGDAGVVAEDESGHSVGAAWYRYFTVNEPGFGFVSPNVPEITIGVAPEVRGRGVGSALLTALIDLAANNECSALSLSVEIDSPALRLYEKAGFRDIGRSGNSVTMKLELFSPQ
jgi:ribosomal protein S18 acetylase RimI-like enzyme